MSTTNGTDWAFSRSGFALDQSSYDLGADGMTKREYIATRAMAAIISIGDPDAEWNEKALAEQAVIFADALVTALNAQPEGQS